MVHLALSKGILSDFFFFQINSVYSFSGCLGNLQLNGASITSASQTFSVTPCFEGPMEAGTYFSAEGGYVVLGKATAPVWLWLVPPKLERKLAPPVQCIRNGDLWEEIQSLQRWMLFRCSAVRRQSVLLYRNPAAILFLCAHHATSVGGASTDAAGSRTERQTELLPLDIGQCQVPC